MSKQIKILSKLDNSILFQCSNSNAKEAYEFAAKLEKMGIEFEFIKPGLPETLLSELSVSDEQKQEYIQSLDQEIHDHDDSCCHK